MKTIDVIRHFGSAANVARAIRISRSAVCQWGEEVPPLRAYQIREVAPGLRDGGSAELDQMGQEREAA